MGVGSELTEWVRLHSRGFQNLNQPFSVDRNVVILKGKPEKWPAHLDGAALKADETMQG